MKPFLALVASLLVASPALAEVKTFGPLRLNFRQAKTMDDSIVILARYSRGQVLFVGVFCKDRLFNFTGAGNQWREWSKPVNVHEARIIDEVCNQI